jgi:hypothetical protein
VADQKPRRRCLPAALGEGGLRAVFRGGDHEQIDTTIVVIKQSLLFLF